MRPVVAFTCALLLPLHTSALTVPNIPNVPSIPNIPNVPNVPSVAGVPTVRVIQPSLPDIRGQFERLLASACAGLAHASLSLGFCANEPPPPAPEPEGGVVINEIAWMGTDIGGTPTENGNAEWIELANPGGSDVDLSGWTVVAEDGTPDISISAECANTTIPTGGFFLLVRTGGSILGVPADCTYTSNALGNTGELLRLRDAADGVVDTVDGSDGWKIGGGEQKGDNDTKETAQRADDGTWFTAAPTPGAANVAP